VTWDWDPGIQDVGISERGQAVGCLYSAITFVVMPPRTENAPVTVIRRG
jgi:hypothetical protein